MMKFYVLREEHLCKFKYNKLQNPLIELSLRMSSISAGKFSMHPKKGQSLLLSVSAVASYK